MENNLMVADAMAEGFILDLTAERKTAYCSLQVHDEASEKVLFNAVNNPQKRFRECINMPIKLAHVYVEAVQVTNRETGEISVAPRSVLIADDGTSYTCVSTGVFSALKKLFQIKGTPDTWEKPVTIIPKVVLKGEYQITTFEIG